MTWPRWLARLLAFLGGYFWLPCPLCGRMFAGFEAGSDAVYHGGRWMLTCPLLECQSAAVWSNALAYVERKREHPEESPLDWLGYTQKKAVDTHSG